ncbi:hypothetical protein ACHAWU_004098 [Discostella pseudostelligera]|uniref:PIPK domain-containing protein n=1 Tax=Discostella pseudostelligera TaxID=259834 RepID=A0ABD3MQR2_9STRA
MAVIEGMASVTSLILTILASLRAASRFEQRIGNHGSIGLMDGPPILGPRCIGHQRKLQLQNRSSTLLLRDVDHDLLDRSSSSSSSSSSSNNKHDEDSSSNETMLVTEEEIISPLWEHTEAFRRAAILGLIFDELVEDDNNTIGNKSKSTSTSSSVAKMFTDIIRVEGKKYMHVRGGQEDDDYGEHDNESHEDLAMAVAVEAGLLSPPPPGSTTRVRGGGGVSSGLSKASLFRKRKGNSNDVIKHDSEQQLSISGGTSNNPLVVMAYWFARELSAPLAVIPAWHKVLCTYWREQKENQMRKSQWVLLSPYQRLRFALTGRYTGQKPYDASHLDFDASISGLAHIPCVRSCMDINEDEKKGNGNHLTTTSRATSISARTTVRVKAFAPKTFRDLRKNCFRVTEGEYAQSILNAMNVASTTSDDGWLSTIDENEDLGNDGDESITHVLHNIFSSEDHHFKSVRRREIQPQITLPYISFQSNSKGAARAGTFFFFTADGAYMIKTVKKEEAKAFLDMLPEYHRFMSDGVNGRNSLLTRIFGMYSVWFPPSEDGFDDEQPSESTGDRWDGGLFPSNHEHISSVSDDERTYLVMHSVFPPDASAFVTERFDLKGSTVGRECSQEERKSKGANAVLKDLDLKREVEEELKKANEDGRDGKITTPRHGICIGRKHKMALMAQLERDVDLLCRCNVLDYSLLVGVVDMEMTNSKRMTKPSSACVPRCIQKLFHWMDFPMPYYGAGMTKVDGGALSSIRGTRKGKQVNYYLGVIDFLQPWTVKKRLERDLKGLAGYDKSAISCVAPTDYADRFLKFFDVHVT